MAERSNVFSNAPEFFIILRYLKYCFLAFTSSGVLIIDGEAVGAAGAVKDISCILPSYEEAVEGKRRSSDKLLDEAGLLS
jgi:hypothetical protein